MINKIKNLFHADKWWGKTIFIVLMYLLFWCLFYGVWLVVTFSLDNYEYDVYRIPLSVFSFLLHIVLPIISFFVFPKFLKNNLGIKYSYLINTIAVFLSILVFIFFEIIIALRVFFNGGFF